ncbi:MAG: hypothetical protein ACO312_08065, partial [Candidatus Nanopelagicaceae bacterium]
GRSKLYVELLMELGDQFELEHLLFKDRKCRVCGEVKDLLTDYYVVRKHKKYLPSAYSYECKDCTVKRVMETRKKRDPFGDWGYPDW